MKGRSDHRRTRRRRLRQARGDQSPVASRRRGIGANSWAGTAPAVSSPEQRGSPPSDEVSRRARSLSFSSLRCSLRWLFYRKSGGCWGGLGWSAGTMDRNDVTEGGVGGAIGIYTAEYLAGLVSYVTCGPHSLSDLVLDL